MKSSRKKEIEAYAETQWDAMNNYFKKFSICRTMSH